jgi:hypothetical protein
MKNSTPAAVAAAIGLAFSGCVLAQGVTKAEYAKVKDGIKAEHKAMKAGCDSLAGNAKDICEAQAKGGEAVALAELEARYKPGVKSRYDVRIAKADAEFSVAKEKCDDQAGNAKDVCVKESKSAHVAAKADAGTWRKTALANQTAGDKAVKARGEADEKIVAARKDAATDKRDAEYAVAKEKCDALAGNTKDACVQDAKSRYGKS